MKVLMSAFRMCKNFNVMTSFDDVTSEKHFFRGKNRISAYNSESFIDTKAPSIPADRAWKSSGRCILRLLPITSGFGDIVKNNWFFTILGQILEAHSDLSNISSKIRLGSWCSVWESRKIRSSQLLRITSGFWYITSNGVITGQNSWFLDFW